MKNQLKTLLLLGALSAMLIGIGGALGPGYLYGFTALALLLNLGAYFFSDRIVLAMHRGRFVDRSATLAERAGLPTYRVSIFGATGVRI